MKSPYANKGSEEWQSLGKKNQPPGPPVRLRLRPEDVLARQGQPHPRGNLAPMHGRANDR